MNVGAWVFIGVVAASTGWGVMVWRLLERLAAAREETRRARSQLTEADEMTRELMAQSRRMAELAIERATTLRVDTTAMRAALAQADDVLRAVRGRTA